jgi:hypothetical protein
MNNIIKKLENIEYGWLDKNNKIHKEINNEFSNNYILQSPEQVIKNKIGVCWDQVELERYLFKKENINFNTYFIVHYDNDKCPTHTFLIYEQNNKYYWFEHSWELFKGIHEYNSELEALKDIKEKFIKEELNNNYEPMNLCIYKYHKPKYGITCIEFYKHCEKGDNIIIN